MFVFQSVKPVFTLPVFEMNPVPNVCESKPERTSRRHNFRINDSNNNSNNNAACFVYFYSRDHVKFYIIVFVLLAIVSILLLNIV